MIFQTNYNFLCADYNLYCGNSVKQIEFGLCSNAWEIITTRWGKRVRYYKALEWCPIGSNTWRFRIFPNESMTEVLNEIFDIKRYYIADSIRKVFWNYPYILKLLFDNGLDIYYHPWHSNNYLELSIEVNSISQTDETRLSNRLINWYIKLEDECKLIREKVQY